MTVEIPDPPSGTTCDGCRRPVIHLWSSRTRQWVRFVTVAKDGDLLLQADRCPHGDRLPSWRDNDITRHDPHAAERARRGRALVDQALRGDL